MNSVAELLVFIPLDGEDAMRLARFLERVRTDLPAIADSYIELVANAPDAASNVDTPEQVTRMRERVVEWLETGLRGPHDHAFYAGRLHVGARHITEAWPQHRTVTFVHVVRMAYHRRIAALYPPAEAWALLDSVNRLLDLELAFLVRHYQLSHRASLSERSREERDERLISLQTLTAGLAHEIRNPLNAAKLQLELAERRLRRAEVEERLLTPVELAQAELDRLTIRLADFLTFAQPVRLNPLSHDVVKLIAAVCDEQRPAAEGRGATLRFVPARATLMASVDGPKLTQVAGHLIRNAIEVVQSGGEVVVELTTTDNSIELGVHDSGQGIPAAVQARIFEPFFSTKEGGTGLGMSIVHSLVALHGGAIHLDTGPQGTRFGVSLPLG